MCCKANLIVVYTCNSNIAAMLIKPNCIKFPMALHDLKMCLIKLHNAYLKYLLCDLGVT
jgi:hypothetical protein